MKIYRWEREQIGNEYDLLTGDSIKGSSHGYAENFEQTFIDNAWNISFDSMSSTAYKRYAVHTGHQFIINNEYKEGSAWLKITAEGHNDIYKAALLPDEEIVIDLSAWDGEVIYAWLVIKDCINGSFEIIHN